MLVVVGGLATVAALFVAAGRRVPGLARPSGSAAAGFVSGFSNVTAGASGPAPAVWSASTDHPRSSFIPPCRSSASLATSCPSSRNTTRTCRWTADLVSERVGRAGVLTLAVAGGLVSVVKGVRAW